MHSLKSTAASQLIIFGLRLASHSRSTRVRVTRKRIPMGSYSVPGQKWPGILSVFCRVYALRGQIPRQVYRFPGYRWPGMEFGSNGPFPGQIWRRCVESESVVLFRGKSKNVGLRTGERATRGMILNNKLSLAISFLLSFLSFLI